MFRRYFMYSWMVVSMLVISTRVEVTLASTQPKTTAKSDTSRLQEVQDELLNFVGNSTRSVKSVGELMPILHSKTGQQMGRLLLEGIMLGAVEKDAATLLSHFLEELQGRLSPELQETVKDYGDFFKSLDLTTLPLAWEKLFKKDQFGNSLADMPMGQLVDLLQPTASKYGVDLVAFLNSVTGRGKNNLRDLLYGALDNIDAMSLLSQFINSTSAGKDVQTSTTEKHPKTPQKEPGTRSRSRAGGNSKKGKEDATLRLFKPLIASLLRENKIDLDADAVLEVLSPLLRGDLVSQTTPLLSALGSQASDSIGPLLSNILGGENGKGMQKQMGALLGGIGALLGGGGNRNMDLTAMLSMASLFMNNGNNKNPGQGAKNKDREERHSPTMKPDLETLASLAGKLAENNDIDINSLLETASTLLESNKKSNVRIEKEIKKDSSKLDAQKLQKEKTNIQKDQKQATVVSSRNSKTKYLTDIVESILLSMQTDKECTRKINNAILFSKSFLNNKMSGLSDFPDLFSRLLSMSGTDFIKRKDLDNMVVMFRKNFAHASWMDLLESLKRDDYRESLRQSITPTLAELITLLATPEVQQRLYEDAMPRTQAILASYGLPGVTLDNFPERVAPMLGLMTRGWNLPFKLTEFLVPLRDYLQGLREWVSTGLAAVRDLHSKELIQASVKKSLKEVGDRVVSIESLTRGVKTKCLPLVLCRINKELQPTSLAAATTRTASLVFASGRALEKTDSTLLIKIVQAASGKLENCEELFSNGCTHSEAEDKDKTYKHKHQEL